MPRSRTTIIGHVLHWRLDERSGIYRTKSGIEVRPTEIPLGQGRVSLGWKLVRPGRRTRPVFGTTQEAMFAAEGIKLHRPRRNTRRRTRRSR